ncbi:hypothetical protein ACEXTD_003006 [Salmonella enterica]
MTWLPFTAMNGGKGVSSAVSPCQQPEMTPQGRPTATGLTENDSATDRRNGHRDSSPGCIEKDGVNFNL